MAEVRSSGKSMEQRLRDRERNSGCDTADITVVPSQGARFHNIHMKGQGPADARLNLNPTADPQKQAKVTR